jgi:prevent-host-death family protein
MGLNTGNSGYDSFYLTISNDHSIFITKGGIMKSMAISSFKAHALRVLDSVATNHESVTVTKRGKPLVKVVPFTSSESKPVPGKLAKTLIFEKDIVTPLGGKMWEAAR